MTLSELFAPLLIEEPFLEFRNGLTLRSPRRGILKAGAFDYAKLPEVKVALLVHHKVEHDFDKFWKLVEIGDSQSGYKGFVGTFGSRLKVLKKSVYEAIGKLSAWVQSESFGLPPYTVVIICMPDSEIVEDYYNLKKAVMVQGSRAQILYATTLKKPSPGFIALGLATAIYAKAGGTPWKLLDPLAPGGYFLGLGFAMAKSSKDIYFGVVEVYDKFGKLIEVIAQTYQLPFFERSSEGLFIPRENLSQILTDIQNKLRPLFLIVHKSGPFHKEELAAFDALNLPQGLVQLEFASVYRLYDLDDQKHAAFRGLLAQDLENLNRGILLTTGNINDTFVQRHSLGTPRSIELKIVKNTVNFTLEQFAGQVLKLTKLDWNTLATAVRKPITIKYASAAAGFASSGYNKTFYDIRDLI